jgi:8-oxo-dGTP pyrophosphatase MutT (NUDIX family)
MSVDFEDQLKDALAAMPPKRTSKEGARAAAVLIPIVGDGAPTILFTVRTETLPSHKGQISFPGGTIDPSDPSPEAAALRETEEEIGLDPAAVRIVGELDTFPTYVTGFVVTPFVGWIDDMPALRPNPAEVAAVLRVPLADLSDAIRADPGFSHGSRTYPTEAWVWNDHVIWGVTARIVRLLLQRLLLVGLADPPGGDPWYDLPVPASRGQA